MNVERKFIHYQVSNSKKNAMKTNHIKDQLIFYIDDDLSDENRKLVAEHLINCKACKNAYEYLLRTLSVIETEKTVAANPFLYTRIAAQIADAKQKNVIEPLWNKVLRPALAVSVIIIGIVSGIFFGSTVSVASSDTTTTAEEEYYLHEMQQEPFEANLLTE